MTNGRERAKAGALMTVVLAIGLVACVATPVGPGPAPVPSATRVASPTLNPNQQEAQRRTPLPTSAPTALPTATPIPTFAPCPSPSPYAPDLVLYRIVDGVDLQPGVTTPADTVLAIEALP